MFNYSGINVNDIFSIEYHFEDENLNIEIREPISIEVNGANEHIITDNDGIFVISPKWVYLSIIKRLNKESRDTL